MISQQKDFKGNWINELAMRWRSLRYNAKNIGQMLASKVGMVLIHNDKLYLQQEVIKWNGQNP